MEIKIKLTSLRGRFALYGALAVLLATLLSGYLEFRLVERETRRAVEEHMLEQAVALARAVETLPNAGAVQSYLERLHEAETDHGVFVVDRQGVVIAAARPESVGQPVEQAMGQAEPRLWTVLAGEEALAQGEMYHRGLRVLELTLPLHGDPDDATAVTGALHYAEPYREFRALATRTLLTQAALGLLFVALLLIPLWLYLRAAVLRPLETVVAANRQVESDPAHAPLIPEADIPGSELGEVMRSRNAMLRRLSGQMQRLAALHAISDLASRSLHPEEIVAAALAAALEVVRADGGRLYLRDETSGELVIRSLQGEEPLAETEPSILLGECLCGLAAQSLDSIACDDCQTDPRVQREFCVAAGFRAVACLPLAAEGQAYGVLRVARTQPRPFDATDLRFLESLAGVLAVALRRAQLYRRLERWSQELEQKVHERTFELQTLQELSQRIGYTLDYEELLRLIQTSLHQVVNFDLSASLVAADPAAGRYESVLTTYFPRPVAPALQETAQQNLLAAFGKLSGQPQHAARVIELRGPDYDTAQSPLAGELRSFFNVPLIVEGETIGLLHVASRQPDAFDENQVRLLYTVAAQASSAVQRLQALLARERAHLEAVVAGLGEGVVLLDGQARVLLANPAAAAMLLQLGQPPLERGQPLPGLGPLSVDEMRAKVGNPQEDLTQVAVLGEEPGPFVQLWAASLQVPEGAALLLTLRDITEERRHEEELSRLSTTDPLTELPNRRRFIEALQTEVIRARRYQTSLALLMIDLDHLKSINDSYGHPAGDEALRQVARAMRSVSRQTDLLARYAGDEFALLLPHTSLAGAEQLARRMLQAVRGVSLENGASLSISLGVAALAAQDDEHGEALLSRADQALYLAKQAGRGCVRTLAPADIEDVKEFEMTEDTDLREQALRQARAEMAGEVKQEIVDIFRELLERLWERLASLIGENSTAAIFRSALLEASRNYPFLQGINVGSAGIRMERLREDLAAQERAVLRAGLLTFTDSVVALLTDLTGNILVRKVAPLVQHFHEELKRET